MIDLASSHLSPGDVVQVNTRYFWVQQTVGDEEVLGHDVKILQGSLMTVLDLRREDWGDEDGAGVVNGATFLLPDGSVGFRYLSRSSIGGTISRVV